MAFSVIFEDNYQHKEVIHELIALWESHAQFTFYTSGSTGKPKPVTFNKAQILKSANITISALGLGSNQHMLLCLEPRFVAGAMMLIRAIVADCPITLMNPSGSFWNRMDEEHPYTFASFVPLQLLSPHFSISKFQRINQVLLGGSNVSPALVQTISQLSNKVYHTYGMTETLTHIGLRELHDAIPGYTLLDSYEVSRLPEGNLSIRGGILPEPIVTSDIGYLNEYNRLVIEGRKDFVINSGAYKISPEKVEQKVALFFGSSQNQLQFVLAAKPHADLGEQAILVLSEEISSEQWNQLRHFLKQRLHPYEMPLDYTIMNGIPLTETGKINRLEIKKWLNVNHF